jgi:hypothetical protein
MEVLSTCPSEYLSFETTAEVSMTFGTGMSTLKISKRI